MRLRIEVLALEEGLAPAPLTPRAASVARSAIRVFNLPVKPAHTFAEVWQLIEERYRRNYLGISSGGQFAIKKLQDGYGADLDTSDTVQEIFDGTPNDQLVVRVVPAIRSRISSIPPESNLQPQTLKRRRDGPDLASKRRKLDVVVEALNANTPIQSTELGGDILVQDSQPDAILTETDDASPIHFRPTEKLRSDDYEVSVSEDEDGARKPAGKLSRPSLLTPNRNDGRIVGIRSNGSLETSGSRTRAVQQKPAPATASNLVKGINQFLKQGQVAQQRAESSSAVKQSAPIPTKESTARPQRERAKVPAAKSTGAGGFKWDDHEEALLEKALAQNLTTKYIADSHMIPGRHYESIKGKLRQWRRTGRIDKNGKLLNRSGTSSPGAMRPPAKTTPLKNGPEKGKAPVAQKFRTSLRAVKSAEHVSSEDDADELSEKEERVDEEERIDEGQPAHEGELSDRHAGSDTDSILVVDHRSDTQDMDSVAGTASPPPISAATSLKKPDVHVVAIPPKRNGDLGIAKPTKPIVETQEDEDEGGEEDKAEDEEDGDEQGEDLLDIEAEEAEEEEEESGKEGSDEEDGSQGSFAADGEDGESADQDAPTDGEEDVTDLEPSDRLARSARATQNGAPAPPAKGDRVTRVSKREVAKVEEFDSEEETDASVKKSVEPQSTEEEQSTDGESTNGSEEESTDEDDEEESKEDESRELSEELGEESPRGFGRKKQSPTLPVAKKTAEFSKPSTDKPGSWKSANKLPSQSDDEDLPDADEEIPSSPPVLASTSKSALPAKKSASPSLKPSPAPRSTPSTFKHRFPSFRDQLFTSQSGAAPSSSLPAKQSSTTQPTPSRAAKSTSTTPIAKPAAIKPPSSDSSSSEDEEDDDDDDEGPDMDDITGNGPRGQGRLHQLANAVKSGFSSVSSWVYSSSQPPGGGGNGWGEHGSPEL